MNKPRGKQVQPLSPGSVIKKTEPGRYADGGGLYLWIKPDGRKTWTFRWRDKITSKLREAGLGSVTNQRVTLKMARERADEYRDMVWRGLDPIEEKRKRIQEARAALANHLTFSDCMTRYIDAHKASWRNKKHTAQWSSTLNTYADPLMKLSVADIDTSLVLQCIEPIWTTKTETATRVRQRQQKQDLFARKDPVNMTPQQRREYRDKVRQSAWKTALELLPLEILIVQTASVDLLRGKPLNAADHLRLERAVKLITNAKVVLCER